MLASTMLLCVLYEAVYLDDLAPGTTATACTSSQPSSSARSFLAWQSSVSGERLGAERAIRAVMRGLRAPSPATVSWTYRCGSEDAKHVACDDTALAFVTRKRLRVAWSVGRCRQLSAAPRRRRHAKPGSSGVVLVPTLSLNVNVLPLGMSRFRLSSPTQATNVTGEGLSLITRNGGEDAQPAAAQQADAIPSSTRRPMPARFSTSPSMPATAAAMYPLRTTAKWPSQPPGVFASV